VEHVHGLEQLLGDLVEGRGGDVDHHRDAAQALVLGGCHGEAEDVEPPPSEQARHAGEHAGLVLDEDGQEVVLDHRGLAEGAHWTKSAPSAGSVMMSSLLLPAGTIGKTFSELSVRKSMTTGRSSISLAFWMAAA